eukprot:scpid78814/ scgid16232/ 
MHAAGGVCTVETLVCVCWSGCVLRRALETRHTQHRAEYDKREQFLLPTGDPSCGLSAELAAVVELLDPGVLEGLLGPVVGVLDPRHRAVAAAERNGHQLVVGVVDHRGC